MINVFTTNSNKVSHMFNFSFAVGLLSIVCIISTQLLYNLPL